MKRILLSALAAFIFVGFATAQTIYISEDFESGQPADWTIEGEWAYGNAAALGSQYFNLEANTTSFMAFNDDGLGGNHMGDGRLETGNYDLTGVTGPVILELRAFFINGDWEGDDEQFIISASYDDGNTWEDIRNFNATSWDYELTQVDEFAGKTVKLAFTYLDGGGWNYGVGIDDIVIADAAVNAVRRSYFLTANGGTQFSSCAQNIEYPVQGIFFNFGYEAVTSFDIVIVNDGVETTTTFDGVNIEKGQAMRYDVPETVSVGEDDFDIEVVVSNVNGEMEEDENTDDNRLVVGFVPVETHPNKAVVVEEATGTWCQWCPRGTVYLDEMSKRFGHNFVGIAVHNGQNDPMVVTAYDANMAVGGYPSAIFNRTNEIDPGAIEGPSISDMQEAPAVMVELGGEENDGALTANVLVTFMDAQADADYNVVMILTEDNLQGENADGAQWTQVNAYSGGGNGPMGGFEFLSLNAPANLWPYSHVGRALMNGFDGENLITGAFAAGDDVTAEVSDYNVSSSFVKDNMHVVALITDSQGRVVNAVSEKYNDVIAKGLLSDTKEVFDASLATVYPNPASDYTNVNMDINDAADVTIEVTDMMGQLVSRRALGTLAGSQNIRFDVSDFATGTYVFKVIAGERVVTQKVSVMN